MLPTPPRNTEHTPPLSGWLVLDKPEGITSAAAVGRVKRLLKPSKIGHAGTLDPLATGLLPLGIGEATKLMRFAMDGSKTYRFTLQFGQSTTTGDREGEVNGENSRRPTTAEIEAILPRFTGNITQIPPVYSALKIGGKRAYALARQGETPEMTPRSVHIRHLRLIEHPGPDTALLEAECGKGTYIRTLGEDIAKALSSLGHLATLRRTQLGKFYEKNAISLEKLEELVHNAPLAYSLHPVDTVLDGIPVVKLGAEMAQRISHGKAIEAPEGLTEGSEIALYFEGKLVAIAEVRQRSVYPIRGLHL